jgi:GTP pyrophosphokinase
VNQPTPLFANPPIPVVTGLSEMVADYLRPEDVAMVERAFEVAARAHEGQKRRSGEPYITHPLAVATICAGWHLDAQALSAALLHDTVEDTGITQLDITQQFGRPVGELVEGLSKLERMEFQSEQQAQAENFRKMLLAMARDVRVILVKLADRLHNMRTLDAMALDKQKRIARETLEIYAPIANRLGLHRVYQELQDLGFRFLHPHRYRVLSKAVKAARGNRRELVGKILTALRQRLESQGVEASVSGREKNLYSIYTKMSEKALPFSKVLDIYGFRILVKDVPACYLALGALHTLYKPIPGKFKDYIGIPKANGYRSLHSTLFGPYEYPIEIQIRTVDMHRVAEAGVASHWMYKSTETSLNEVQQQTHQWLQSLLEIQTENRDPLEFLEHIKVDLFPGEVYVFTPKGMIKSLPRGATCVDFAYAVHTGVGNRCVAAKVNNELAPLRTVLKSGDRVEIITSPDAVPHPAWLSFVASGKARSHIRHFLKTRQYSESAELGERLLNQALRSLQIDPQTIKRENWDQLLKGDRAKTREEVLADIGLGRRLNLVVARRLLQGQEIPPSEPRGPRALVMIRGTEGLAVQLATCCRPIPGDPIIGLIKKGQGLVVHTHECHQIRQSNSGGEDWIDVEWESTPGRTFEVTLRLMVVHKRGVLAMVAGAFAEAHANIESVFQDQRETGAYASIHFTISVRDRNHLAEVMRVLRTLPEVVRIARIEG